MLSKKAKAHLAASEYFAVWGMRVVKDSPLASISASSKHLKRVQTPHSLLWDFWAEKPSSLVGQVAESKFESKLEPCHLFGLVNPEAYSGRQNENFVCKINGPALGAALQQGLGRLDLQAQTQGPGCFLVDCSRRWPQLVRLRKKCYHSCYADLVWDSKRFLWFVNFGSDDDFFFHVKWNFQ